MRGISDRVEHLLCIPVLNCLMLLERLRPLTNFFVLISRISPGRPAQETSAYNTGKCGISPIDCRPKVGNAALEKRKQIRVDSALSFCCMRKPSLRTCLFFGMRRVVIRFDLMAEPKTYGLKLALQLMHPPSASEMS
jgi:hypothetical protein